MHVAWAGLLRPHATRPRPTLEALRQSVAARLALLPRFRQRLASDPLGLADPRWVDDRDFDVRAPIQGERDGDPIICADHPGRRFELHLGLRTRPRRAKKREIKPVSISSFDSVSV